MIIDFVEKNLCPLRLAITACAEKINPVIYDLKACLFDNFLCQVFKTAQIRINYYFTLCANYVGVGIRLVAVIAIAPIRESKFQHLVELLKKVDRFVNGGDAGCWKFCPDSFINPFNSRMSLANRQHF